MTEAGGIFEPLGPVARAGLEPARRSVNYSIEQLYRRALGLPRAPRSPHGSMLLSPRFSQRELAHGEPFQRQHSRQAPRRFYPPGVLASPFCDGDAVAVPPRGRSAVLAGRLSVTGAEFGN